MHRNTRPPLVFGKFVSVDVIGSLNSLNMSVGKHYFAPLLAVIILTIWILIIEHPLEPIPSFAPLPSTERQLLLSRNSRVLTVPSQLARASGRRCCDADVKPSCSRFFFYNHRFSSHLHNTEL